MKNNCLISASFLLLFQLGNCQTFDWSAKANQSNPTGATGLVTDQTSHTYVVGEFEPDKIYSGESSPTGSFFSKYDNNGVMKWTKVTTSQYLTVAIGPGDQLYIAGMDSTGYYIAQYDSSGTDISRTTVLPRTTNVTRALIKGIGVDSNSNYYICGSFCDTITIGSHSAISPPRVYKMFVAKFNSSDVCQWIQTSESPTDIIAFTVDGAGNSYIGGEYMQTFVVGTTTLQTDAFSAGFVVKYNNSGTLQWMYEIDGDQQQYVQCLATDNSGNVYVGGYFDISLDVGLDVSGDANAEIFLLKLNNSASLSWAVKMGGAKEDYLNGLSVDASGNAYLAGSFESSSAFGQSITLESGSSVRREPFIAKYNSSGSAVWAVEAGCSTGGQGYCYAIGLDSAADIITAGSFVGNIDFGSHALNDDKVSMFVTHKTIIIALPNQQNYVLPKMIAVPDTTTALPSILQQTWKVRFLLQDSLLYLRGLISA